LSHRLYRHHPHLTSFPTRRSSDLPPPPGALLASQALFLVHDGTDRKRLRTAARGVERLPPAPASIQIPVPSSATHRNRERRAIRSEEHTSELQSPYDLVCRLLLEK